jgi:hypothetical protein
MESLGAAPRGGPTERQHLAQIAESAAHDIRTYGALQLIAVHERRRVMIRHYICLAARMLFALWYFGVGVIGFITNDAVKDAANAPTALEKAMAETGFMNPLLCAACLFGGGAMFFRRTTPLGIVILAPLVIIIFCFHMIITKSYLWGSLNFLLLSALAWEFRRGFDQLWNYAGPAR